MAGKNKGPRIIKRKETEYERKERFVKRSKGLLKKAFQLSVLCDIDVALIMYSPTDKLRHFSGYKKPERILQDYIQSLATNPKNQDLEINEEIRQYQNKLVLLQEQAKKLYPNQGISNSIQELMECKRYLGENQLLSRFNISPPNTQGQQLQQLQGGPGPLVRIGIEAPLVAIPQSHEGASPHLQDSRFIAPQENEAVQEEPPMQQGTNDGELWDEFESYLHDMSARL
ncbi:Agamous-like MADS-box protein AGL14 [Carex littledalei]|uniref:Agamous-like MADS-box protein AGL14 n=1 Tax=Carex littledalei TaxID=544730 RepID=A0A833RIQ8_9POAL|nr:Agamous-like MADS-box protein AGL14 [Carex littledalei]